MTFWQWQLVTCARNLITHQSRHAPRLHQAPNAACLTQFCATLNKASYLTGNVFESLHYFVAMLRLCCIIFPWIFVLLLYLDFLTDTRSDKHFGVCSGCYRLTRFSRLVLCLTWYPLDIPPGRITHIVSQGNNMHSHGAAGTSDRRAK